MAPRLLKRKRVPILSGEDEYDADTYVDIPVIAEMDIVGSRGQEFRYRFRNDSSTQLRTVQVKKVGNATGEFGNATIDTEKYVNAERILTMAYVNSVEMTNFRGLPVLWNQAWRTDKKFKNLDPAPKQPDGSDDPHHLEVHYVRFYKNNNIEDTLWIDVEYIDKMELVGTNGQEFIYRFRHPTAEDYAALGGQGFGEVADDDDPYQPIIGWCDPTLELLDVEFNEDTGNPVPARLDPLQNIVNCSGGEFRFVSVTFNVVVGYTQFGHGAAPPLGDVSQYTSGYLSRGDVFVVIGGILPSDTHSGIINDGESGDTGDDVQTGEDSWGNHTVDSIDDPTGQISSGGLFDPSKNYSISYSPGAPVEVAGFGTWGSSLSFNFVVQSDSSLTGGYFNFEPLGDTLFKFIAEGFVEIGNFNYSMAGATITDENGQVWECFAAKEPFDPNYRDMTFAFRKTASTA